MTPWIQLAAAALAASAAAEPSTAVIATGDCRDTELLGSMQIFSDALRVRLAGRLMDEAKVLERFRPRPSLSLEEVQRLAETAEAQFLDGQVAKAAQGLALIDAELDRFSAAAHPWRLRARVWALHGRVLRSQGKPAESVEWFKKVLRVDPGYKLDPLVCPPSQVAQFEAVRRELASVAKASLQVNSTPAGAEVFLDGAVVGKTPFAGSFPVGEYTLALVRQEAVSFARPIALRAGLSLHVDLAFESSLSAHAPLCIYASGLPAQLDPALRLANLLEVEEAVVLRLEARRNEPGWVTAALVDLSRGTRLREGGMKAAAGWSGEGLEDLAEFVVTGRARRAVVAIEPAKPKATAEPAAAETGGGVTAAPAAVSASPASGPPRWMRWSGYGLTGAGAVALGSAGAVWLSGAAGRDRLKGLLDAEGRLPLKGSAEYDEALRLREAQAANGQLVTGLAVGGALAAAAGVTLWVMSSSEAAAPSVAVLPAPGGVGIAGRF